ncbi:MAG: type I glyceraldehyde-3-phosphate dehydrogenase [Saprospirales bacterium]|nr:MAG: type I glyceraldehyde-3-phosphate dehydrogenase [Saprospirales bacterium]
MTKIRVAINGFGRIGRLSLKAMMLNDAMECIAINDLTDVKTLVHLLKYDSAHGHFPYKVEADGADMVIDDRIKIKCYNEKDPRQLPWTDLNIDVVLESTGIFLTKELASKHRQAGAKKVVLSAPGKGGDIPTIVMGVNENTLHPEDTIISNASCTTNCLAPVAKVLEETFGIKQGFMTTIHAYTADQRLMDAPHKDLRRARSAAVSIIPTTTGATKATEIVLPSLKGKLSGSAMRVPVVCGSATEFTFMLDKEASVEAINGAMKEAADGSLNGILQYIDEPLVSTDIIGNSHSSVFDSLLTSKVGDLYRVMAWYDNEFAYAQRSVELMEYAVRL